MFCLFTSSTLKDWLFKLKTDTGQLLMHTGCTDYRYLYLMTGLCHETPVSIVSSEIFYVTILLCLNILWLKAVSEITARQARTSLAKFSMSTRGRDLAKGHRRHGWMLEFCGHL